MNIEDARSYVQLRASLLPLVHMKNLLNWWRGSGVSGGQYLLSKVPEVTIFFWVIKVLCTTVGETASDFLNVNLNFGLTGSDATIKISEEQLRRQGKLKAPLDYSRYVYADLLRQVRPQNVRITALAPK